MVIVLIIREAQMHLGHPGENFQSHHPDVLHVVDEYFE